MTKWLFPAIAGCAALAALAGPPRAHAQMQNGVLIIYGDDKCPTDKNGDEIVVCARRPETERYRIPKELRDVSIKPENRSWATRAADVGNVGRTGIGSCSTVGPGGFTGCEAQIINRGSRESRERRSGQTPEN